MSQHLDEPLHELEERFLAAHLVRCGPCRVFESEAHAFTALLRRAPLEPLPVSGADFPRFTRRRRIHAFAQAAPLASAFIIAAGVALAQGMPSPGDRVEVAREPSAAIGADELLSVFRRKALAEGGLQIVSPTVRDAPAATPVKPALPVEGQ